MIHVTCRLTAKNRDQLQNPMLANRATFLSFYSTQLPGTRQKFASSRDFLTVNYSVQIMQHVHL